MNCFMTFAITFTRTLMYIKMGLISIADNTFSSNVYNICFERQLKTSLASLGASTPFYLPFNMNGKTVVLLEIT